MSTEESVDWRQLREFVGVDLLQSFVLSWRVERETLLIDVDLLLTEEHPFYERPRPAERVCIRPAVIEFPYCESVHVGGCGDQASLENSIAALGGGAISSMRRLADGRYELRGDFGSVCIDAERPILRLDSH